MLGESRKYSQLWFKWMLTVEKENACVTVNVSVCQVLKLQKPNIPAAKLWDNIKNIFMTAFPHGIDVKIVALTWKTTNHSG